MNRSKNEILNKLSGIELFSYLPVNELEKLSSNIKIIYLKKNETLYKEHEDVGEIYFVIYGFFKLQKKVAYELTVILNFLGRGEFLGIEMSDLPAPRFLATALALEDSAVIVIPRLIFKELLAYNPAIAVAVQQQIGHRLTELHHDRCMENVRLPVRLADFLIRLLGRQPAHHGSRIMIPMTRKEISQRLGKQTETVIRILSQWAKLGLIKTENHYIEILDLEGLKKLVVINSRPQVTAESDESLAKIKLYNSN